MIAASFAYFVTLTTVNVKCKNINLKEIIMLHYLNCLFLQVELFQSCEEDDLKVDLPNLSEDSLSNCFCISLNAMRSFYQCQLCENENSINGEENWQQCIKKFVLSVCSEDERQKQLLVSALSVFVSAYVKVKLTTSLNFSTVYYFYFYLKSLYTLLLTLEI